MNDSRRNANQMSDSIADFAPAESAFVVDTQRMIYACIVNATALIKPGINHISSQHRRQCLPNILLLRIYSIFVII